MVFRRLAKCDLDLIVRGGHTYAVHPDISLRRSYTNLDRFFRRGPDSVTHADITLYDIPKAISPKSYNHKVESMF